MTQLTLPPSIANERWVPHCPDFLWRLVALIHSMRLSLMKGARADLSCAAWQEIGSSPVFGLEWDTQHSTTHQSPSSVSRSRGICGSLNRQKTSLWQVKREMTQQQSPWVRGPEGRLAKRACPGLPWEPSPEGLGINPEHDMSAVGAALNLGSARTCAIPRPQP
jgi:hypothetical protein